MFRYRTDAAAYYRSDRTVPVTQVQLRQVRNQLADGLMAELDRIAEAYAAGDMTLGEWAEAFGRLIRQGTTAGWLLGGGGVNALSIDQMGRIDALIAEQTMFGERFVRDLATAGLSPDETKARAEMYAGTAVTAYEQAMAYSNGIDLPVYPGDGGTDCLSRCRCSWTIETTDDQVTAWWDTAGDERVCDGCSGRASQYNPLVVPR